MRRNPRKPTVKPPPDRFAELLSEHLRRGMRNGLSSASRWTDQRFADAITVLRADKAQMSDRTVSNWRKGTALPVAIEPILAVLFGTEAGVPARGQLLRAYRAAWRVQAETTAATLRKAKPVPGGVTWVARDDHLVIDRVVNRDDARAANDPQQRALQAEIAEQARRLAAATHRPGYNSEILRRVSACAEAVGGLLDCPADELPDRLLQASALSLRLATLLEIDDAARIDQTDAPLDALVRGDLALLARLTALWLRGFPSVTSRDRPLAFADTLIGPALALNQIAMKQGAVTAEDNAAMLLALLPEDGTGPPRRPPRQAARQARNLAVADVVNFLLAAATRVAVAQAGLGVLSSADAALAQRLAATLHAAGTEVAALAETQPADVRHALGALQAVIGQAGGTVVPHPPPADPPVPDDVEEQARALILAGQAPPETWRPFIGGLDFTRTQVSDLTPLTGLTALKTLWLRETPVSDVTPLAGLAALRLLDLDRTQVSDVTSLAQLSELLALWLAETPVSDVTPLAGLHNLGILSLKSTRVSDVSPLNELTALQSLTLDWTQVSDLTPIAGLTALEMLHLRGTQVSDVTPLAGLTALQTLYLHGTQVSDVTSLAGLTALQRLDLDGTPVSDVTPLAGLTALQTLYLHGTQVSDVTPLAGLTALEDLTLPDGVTDPRPGAHRR